MIHFLAWVLFGGMNLTLLTDSLENGDDTAQSSLDPPRPRDDTAQSSQDPQNPPKSLKYTPTKPRGFKGPQKSVANYVTGHTPFK